MKSNYQRISSGLILAFLLSVGGISVVGQESGPKSDRPVIREGNNEARREIRQKIEKLRAEVRALTDAGKIEEANELKEKIGRLERELKPNPQPNIPELEQRLREMSAKIEDLRKNGRLDAANDLEKQARELKERIQANRQKRPEGDRVAMEEKVRQMGREIEELRRNGRLDAANDLEQKARQLKEQMARQPDRPVRLEGDQAGMEAKVRQMGKEIDELRRLGRQEEADRLEQKARDIKEQMARNKGMMPMKGMPENERKIQHLKIAIENLRAAGLHEIANNVQRQLEQIKSQPVRKEGAMPDQMAAMLKERLGQMQDQINELRQGLREMRDRMMERNR